MKITIITYFIAALMVLSVSAQSNKRYAETANDRATKIVEALQINPSKKQKVRKLIAKQYIDLKGIHTERNKLLNKNALKTGMINKNTAKRTAQLHRAFLFRLGALLNAKDIEKVKDGMTYHTVPLTYANYMLMLPYLSDNDKASIMTLLKMAREAAMDGGSAKEKHAIFNKYKGKIANYLSAGGYQLKQEGEYWAKRRDTTSSALEITASNRIISILALENSEKKEIIRNLIAFQYQKISRIQAVKLARQEAIKKTAKTTDEVELDNQTGWEESKSKLDQQRDAFTGALQSHLTLEQVEVIKNEMTAQSVKKEYEKFMSLLPDLTDGQKKKVLDYLIEARENALNVLSSRERNQWFAKFRGRANNYLSAQGYDLRKATEALEKKNSTTP